MAKDTYVANDLNSLQEKIRAAFPDVTFSGAVTGADGLIGEELDEEQALYETLSGRRWSEISDAFIEQNPDGIALLSDEAFATFLPGWLICALHNAAVREMVVYFFSPDDTPTTWMDNRIRQLSRPQRDALCTFMARCLEFESSEYVKEHAQKALAYIESLTK